MAAAASRPLEAVHLNAERGQAASDALLKSSFGTDFPFVTPGTLDKPIDFVDTPNDQHGLAPSEYVSAAYVANPVASQGFALSCPC